MTILVKLVGVGNGGGLDFERIKAGDCRSLWERERVAKMRVWVEQAGNSLIYVATDKGILYPSE